MKVIPVIDVQKSRVVHAVAGQRENYQPLRSILTQNSDPLEVARAFKSSFGFTDLYLADLDAIMGGEPSLSLIRRIRDITGFDLLVDAGAKTVQEAWALRGVGVSKVVVGTETLPALEAISPLISALGAAHIAVSIDTNNDRILSSNPYVAALPPQDLSSELNHLGVSTVILLELAKVGTGLGMDLPLIKSVRKAFKREVLVGGGVRGVQDLATLRGLGVDGVLIATALHTGAITRQDLAGNFRASRS